MWRSMNAVCPYGVGDVTPNPEITAMEINPRIYMVTSYHKHVFRFVRGNWWARDAVFRCFLIDFFVVGGLDRLLNK